MCIKRMECIYEWGIKYKNVLFHCRCMEVAIDLYISPQGAKSQYFQWKIHVVLFVLISVCCNNTFRYF